MYHALRDSYLRSHMRGSSCKCTGRHPARSQHHPSRVQRRKGESIEAHPELVALSRRVLDGLGSIHTFTTTSAFQQCPAGSMEVAKDLFKAAMNYRHDIFNSAMKQVGGTGLCLRVSQGVATNNCNNQSFGEICRAPFGRCGCLC